MNFKIVAFLVLLSMFAGTYYAGRNAGYNECQSEILESTNEAEEEDQQSVREIIKWREKEKKVYVDKIKYIRLAKDPTGCADTKLTDMGFGLQ